MGDEPESLEDLEKRDNSNTYSIDRGNGPEYFSIPTLWTDNNQTLSQADVRRLFTTLADFEVTDPTSPETVMYIRDAIGGDWVDGPLGPNLNHDMHFWEMRALLILDPSVEEIQSFMGEECTPEQAENIRRSLETIKENFNYYYMSGDNRLWTLPDMNVYYRTEGLSLSQQEIRQLVHPELLGNAEKFETIMDSARQGNPLPMAESIKTRLSEDELQQLIELRKQGLREEDIAELLVVSGDYNDMETARIQASAIIQALDYMIDPTQFPEARPLSAAQPGVEKDALAAVQGIAGIIGVSSEVSHDSKAPNSGAITLPTTELGI